jgi:hypothetical protein
VEKTITSIHGVSVFGASGIIAFGGKLFLITPRLYQELFG